MQVPLGPDLTAWGHVALSGQAADQALRLTALVFEQDCADDYPRHVPIPQALHGDLFRPACEDSFETWQRYERVHLGGGRGCPTHDDCRMFRLESALLPLDPADSFQVQLIAASHLPMPLPARCNHGQQYTLLQRLRQANISTGKLFEGRLPRGSRLLKESFLDDVACCNGAERP